MFTTPQEAEQAFYQALRQADLALMMRVWADDEDIVCIHPGGVRVAGHAAVHDTWQQIFNNGPVVVTPVQPLIMSSVMSSVHVLIEQITIKMAQGPQTANCYATNVFHKGRTGWKMVMHHASHAPQETDILGLQDRPDTLH
jgi:ketosteroid isomerase-like protein